MKVVALAAAAAEPVAAMVLCYASKMAAASLPASKQAASPSLHTMDAHSLPPQQHKSIVFPFHRTP